MICHVTVRTAKLDETAGFYQWLLELPVSRKLKTPIGKIIFLGEDETKLELIEDHKADKIDARGLTVGFKVGSLDEKISMLDSKQIAHSEIMSPSPNVRYVFFSDLNGCEIQLLEEKG